VKKLIEAVHSISAVLLIIAIVVNCANVIGRYVFSYPFAAAEEIMLFLLVAIVFFGNSVVAFQGRQIRMDIFLLALPTRVRRWIDIISDIVALAVSALLIAFGWPVITMLAEFDQRSQAADLPLVVPQSAIPVGLGLTIIFLCSRIVSSIKTVNDVQVHTDTLSH
jgi:TRAP-type C4-dicarboxylate transport system permease small subunit